MADRSWGRFEIPDTPQTRELAERFGFGPEFMQDELEETDYPGGVIVIDDESAGGGWEFHAALVEARIPFRWDWDSCGGAYDGGCGVYVPEIPESIELSGGQDSGPSIPIDLETGEPRAHDLARAKEFARVNKLVPEAIARYVRERAEVEAV